MKCNTTKKLTFPGFIAVTSSNEQIALCQSENLQVLVKQLFC